MKLRKAFLNLTFVLRKGGLRLRVLLLGGKSRSRLRLRPRPGLGLRLSSLNLPFRLGGGGDLKPWLLDGREEGVRWRDEKEGKVDANLE